MDFKSLINKENFKAILHHHLKSQVHAKFANTVSQDIQTQSENEPVLPDTIVSSISRNISHSDDYKEFMKTFLNSINHLFEDREKYVPKEDNQGTVSQCSSASSVNTSIDYISFDQFQDIIHTLSNGVSAEKLEALETFSRLPSLEHIIKQTLWPSVEVGLHGALLSSVSLLREASLKVYTKMLSSSEPKVVQEGFNSLIKHVIQNILPSMNQNNVDFISKCKSVVEIIAILNKFLQNIPSHWLRYPQQVIEDITAQSVSILSYGSKNSKIFPIWLCVALCDKKSKWLKNMLYGHVSRSYLLDALQKDSYTIKLALQFCDNFTLSDNHVCWDECCQNFAEVAEITHVICFLSHLLKYSQGREMFSSVNIGESLPWINVLDLLMKCTQKLCSISCLNCCAIACDVLSKTWYHIWSSDNISTYCDSLIKILLNFEDIESLSMNSVCFIIKCLCQIPCDFTSMTKSEEIGNTMFDFICTFMKYLTHFLFDFPNISPEASMLLNSSLIFMQKIISDPSNLFTNLKFNVIFSSWCLKINSISKSLTSSYGPGMKTNLVLETEQNFSRLFISMLQKPNSVFVLHNIELFETSVNMLLEKILEDIRFKSSVCPRDIATLSMALNIAYSTKSILNKSIIFKLSSVIWQFDTSNLENLPKVQCILETLIPSIFPHIFESEILLDASVESDIRLFQYIILFPSLSNEEFVMFEEYSTLALHIISLLTCSILASCYLQAKHKLSDMLFHLQSNHSNENDMFMIDAVSVIQNHILVKLFTVGGSEERVLPPETLLSNKEEYDWPFFMNCPVAELYYHKLNSSVITTSVELNSENFKDIFLEYMELDTLTVDMVSQILAASVNVMESAPALSRTLNFVTLDLIDHIVLHDEILVGVEMTKRYGEILNLLKDEDEKVLEKLLKAGKCLLCTENKFQLDLFICTLSLIFKCDIQTAWSFLETFAQSPASLFIWHERVLQAADQNGKYVTILNTIMEYCDIIVKQTLPLVYSAFQFGKILPSVLFKYWTMHCYWNYLEFTEIAHLILVSVAFGGDFAIYFFASILKHIQCVILKNAHSFNLINLLKKNAIQGYKMYNYMGFMKELSDCYKSKISKSVTDILSE